MEKVKQTRIVVFGTFDFLHPGHIHKFAQARKLAKHPYLIVSVATDKNVKRIKGQVAHYSQNERARLLSSCKLVDQVVFGAQSDYLGSIVKLKPDIIALGYDQVAYTDNLEKLLLNRGLKVTVVRLKAYKPHIFKTQKFKGK
ncbi:MAG TPA: adenylyltransferase/cytidyltransferase family protein [Patescibacteria group bacterium]|nr:adenylyltransferase/cytidyltransferase family protein [Patescibacteria group bacterium]